MLEKMSGNDLRPPMPPRRHSSFGRGRTFQIGVAVVGFTINNSAPVVRWSSSSEQLRVSH